MDTAIQKLLDALEAAESAGASLNDTVLREPLFEVIYQGFIHQEPGYTVPPDLLLNYTDAASQQNATVVAALERFLREAKQAASTTGLNTPEAREDAFLNSEATSSSEAASVGSYFD